MTLKAPLSPSRSHSHFLLASSILTGLLITMGGVVCVTQSIGGCPDWPTCYGGIIPPARADAVIEFLHRIIAALTAPFILISAFLGWSRSRDIRYVSRPPLLAIFFVIAVAIFGAFAVLQGLPPWIAAIDVGSALIVLALLVTSTVVAFARRRNPALPDRLNLRSPLAQLALWSALSVYVLLVSGVFVAQTGPVARCLGWPSYSDPVSLSNLTGWIVIARRIVGVVAGILIVILVVQAWRTLPRQDVTRRSAMVLGLLFVIEMIIAVIMSVSIPNALLLVIYVAAAAAIWGWSVAVVISAAYAAVGTFTAQRRQVQPTKSPT